MAGQTARDEANPYGWLPYLVLPNNPSGSQFWGESDLVDLLDVCRELNTRLSVLSRILDVSGAPIAVLENVDGSEGIAVGPGAKWELPEGARAYLLDLLAGNGVRLHVEYIEQLRTALHDLAETPRTAFGEAGRAIAGAALQVELQPLVQRVNRMRRGLASLYRRRNAMLLDLMERFGGAPIGGLRRTVPVWPPILPSDREAEARVGRATGAGADPLAALGGGGSGGRGPGRGAGAHRRGGAAAGRAEAERRRIATRESGQTRRPGGAEAGAGEEEGADRSGTWRARKTRRTSSRRPDRRAP